eukprot:TRINITY_DN9498_c0_g1_i1.p1 TRINITY_DN9498_c0_g1~~TRINITY_DN9498_c0_g1_i1.p1  ORF type:complete len:156 (-),score=7.35 TRINITY_DN9498_c0_g1_i1:273-740(-)
MRKKGKGRREIPVGYLYYCFLQDHSQRAWSPSADSEEKLPREEEAKNPDSSFMCLAQGNSFLLKGRCTLHKRILLFYKKEKKKKTREKTSISVLSDGGGRKRSSEPRMWGTVTVVITRRWFSKKTECAQSDRSSILLGLENCEKLASKRYCCLVA